MTARTGTGTRVLLATALLIALTWAPDGKITPAAWSGQSPAAEQAAPAQDDGDEGESRAAGATAVDRLSADLDAILERGGGNGERWGVHVVSLDRADTLYAHGADTRLAPASNMKLFTTAAALYYLGPSHRFSTYLLADGPVRDGVLDGDLVVYGTGDPTLSARFEDGTLAVWQRFADRLQALGIRAVRGDVVGDATYFDGMSTGLGWREQYMNAWYAAPASALSYHDNVVTLRVRPAERAGWRPAVELVPGGRGIAVVNQATTTAGGGSRIRVDRAAYDGPIVVRGQIRRGHAGIWREVPVADPARYAAAVFAEVLEAAGIRVGGDVRSVRRPATSRVTGRTAFAPRYDDSADSPQVLAVHRSPPLLEILRVINGESHNLYAELVLRAVGRAATGDGSVRGGARAIAAMLERETGESFPGLRIFDGSGLSVLNRVTARGVTRLLGYMARSPHWDSYWATLPEAGTSAGLGRMYRTAAAGRLRAKTGTIRSVSALSGYVHAANGEWLAFSIISNDVGSTWRSKRIEDAIGARLASFTRPAAARAAAAAQDTAATATTAGPATPVAPSPVSDSTRYHVIRPGDTLEAIARRYGTTVRALVSANPGIRPRRLLPGERIRLP